MEDLKLMLLGIAIMLAFIVFHLFMADGLITDVFAAVGLVLVIVGYYRKDS